MEEFLEPDKTLVVLVEYWWIIGVLVEQLKENVFCGFCRTPNYEEEVFLKYFE